MNKKCNTISYEQESDTEKFWKFLTAFVLTALWRAAKKYGSARSRITDALKEEQRSRFDQSTLRIKNFKYGSSLSIFDQKNNGAQRSQVSQF